MAKSKVLRLMLAVGCYCCVTAENYNVGDLGGTEFSGGSVTGPLLNLSVFGVILFLLALIGNLAFPRVASVISLGASLLCLPLCIYFLAPVPFAEFVNPGGSFKIQPAPGFHWDVRTVAELLALAATSFVSIRVLAFFRAVRSRRASAGPEQA